MLRNLKQLNNKPASKSQTVVSSEVLRKAFQNPSSRFRGKGFWAWNSELIEPELRNQIKIMKQMGMGGFFMHARVGLKTPYLGREWFECIKACCEEARKNGMEAWLYDEDRWPSGFAGGGVTKDPRYRLKRMHLKIFSTNKFQWTEDILAAFSAKINNTAAYEVKPLKRDDWPAYLNKDYLILSFSQRNAQKSANFNGTSYVDTLSEKAIEKFIELTHQRYREELNGDFGTVLPGIFTDEPHHGPVCDLNTFWMAPDADTDHCFEIPWTTRLPEYFQRWYGYDIIKHLPALFFDLEGDPISQVRHHYHDCITRLFTTSFSSQIGSWCREHNLQFTGHVLHEDPLSMQASYVGSAMRFYEHMDIPGVDTIAPVSHEYTTIKQCSSVANQLGKKVIMSEMYGATGWDYPIEGYKAIGDWQAALGVNMRCLHLQWYTMKGEAKRDYPASIFYQSPWWQDYKMLEDYFARINLISQNSTPVRDVLVIHPNESMWQLLKVRWTEDTAHKKMDQDHRDLCRWLLEGHIDFDYADEEMLSRFGHVNTSSDFPRMTVGQSSYSVILVPHLLTLRRSTLHLLMQFVTEGGSVVVVESLPGYVDACPSDEAISFNSLCTLVEFNKKSILQSLDPYRQISIQNSHGEQIEAILYSLSILENGQRILFLVNTSRKKQHKKVLIHFRAIDPESQCEQWDAQSGKFYQTPIAWDGTQGCIHTSLDACESRIYIFCGKSLQSLPIAKSKVREDAFYNMQPIEGDWSISLSEPNVVVLDYCQYKIENGPWESAKNVLLIDRIIRQQMGLAPRGGRMVQPWFQKAQKRQGPNIALRFSFEVKTIPVSPLYIAVEQPNYYNLRVNGYPVNNKTTGYWVDKCLGKIPLDISGMQRGQNILEMEGCYEPDVGIESVFLLGQFGVNLKGTLPVLVKASSVLSCGDWVTQGFPFYSGSIRYSQQVQLAGIFGHVELVIPEFAGSLIKIFINDQEIDCLGWPPYRRDITEYTTTQFKLSIEICSHRRNSFGPLHAFGLRPGKPNWVGPDEFVTFGDRWKDSYNLVPCGLIGLPYLLISDI